MNIICWNINGWSVKLWDSIADMLHKDKPELLCLQETKVSDTILNNEAKPLFSAAGYSIVINAHVPAMWHGILVAIRSGSDWTPLKANLDCTVRSDNRTSDACKGRLISVQHGKTKVTVVFTYVPNAGQQLKHLNYRLSIWNPTLYSYLKTTASEGKRTIWMGDLNVAPSTIDVSNPTTMKKYAGFTVEERKSHSMFLNDSKWVDVWRHQHPNEQQYSWRGRHSNVTQKSYGMRLDAAIVSPDLLPRIKKSWIDTANTSSSDHVPIGIQLEMPDTC